MSVTVYNNSPHWDDFDETKGFYRIIFRPAQSVQTREMNQLQTIIANQIDRLSAHFFKDGSPVIGGNVLFDDKYSFVKVESTFSYDGTNYVADNYASEFVDTLITGLTSGVVARVLEVVQPEDTDPLTLYVRYENSGTSNVTQTFEAEEVFQSNAGVVRYGKVKPSVDTPTGYGSKFSVTEGYWYANSALVYASEDGIILDKYNTSSINTRIVYQIVETTITEAEDTSLLDNSLGTPNFSAPGAYRQKITLQLKQESLELTELVEGETVLKDRSDKIIPLVSISDSRVKKSARTEYSELGDTLAQRTFDESGNYTVNPFGINIREFYNDGSNFGLYDSSANEVTSLDVDLPTAINLAEKKIAVGIERGKAYVFGYPVEVEDTFYISIDKSRDVEVKNAGAVTARVGNYIRVNNISSLPDITNYSTLNLRNSGNTNIGTARARAIEFVSGTTYNLYIFDIKMNSGESFSDVDNIQQTVSYGGSQFTCDLVSSSILDSGFNKLLFDLPFDTVKTLRSVSNDVDFIYDVRDFFTGTITSGSLTIPSGNASFLFLNSSINDYIVTRSDGTILVPDSVTINDPASSVTLNFTGQDGQTIYVSATVSKSNLQEKSKTLVEDVVINIPSPSTSQVQGDELGKVDILKIKSITEGGVDITDRYILDNGQRDNFYTQGRIRLKSGATPPSSAIVVTLDHFEHGTGDYFSVDSYSNIDYEDIPSYKNKSLRDVIDFRPVKDNSGTDFTSTGSSRVDMIKPNSVIRTDIQYYLPRIDKIYVDKYGKFGVIKGISSQPPQPPNNPKDVMVLYSLYINPYTFDEFGCIPKLIDNSRSTMEDIRKISRRVANLEYYTTLSLIEKETADLQLLDGSGLERFKNGFIADGFFGHNLSDVNNAEYSASIDKTKGHLRPSFYEDNVKLFYNSSLSSNIQKTGALLTLPYSEVIQEEQPYASETINVNPYNVFSWGGGVTLSPSSDEWKETQIRPDVIVNNEGIYNSLLGVIDEADVIGTFWNEWETNWTGIEVSRERDVTPEPRGWPIRITDTVTTTQTTAQSRDGIERRVVADTITNQLGDRVVEVNFIPFMRSRKVYFKAERMKPNTRVYPFFDGQNISSYAKQEGVFSEYADRNTEEVINYFGDTSHPDGSSSLVTDSSGTVQGSFIIPNNSSLKFKTGSRLFKLTDSSTNNQSQQTTFAEVVYEARGIIETKENLIVSTQVPRIERSTLQDSRVVVDRRVAETTRYVDPLAQTFVIDKPGGIFATSIDIFFETKDDNIPVTLQLVSVENGQPTQRVVPFSEVTLSPSSVNTSTDGASQTKFTFRSPVYLQQNVEYAVVLLANSSKYKVFISKIGDFDIRNTSYRIDKQPHNGVFFKSQNASTWTPDQDRDLKFNINRAEFTQTSGSIVFNNAQLPLKKLGSDPLLFTNASNTIRVYHKNHGMFEGSRVRITGVEATSGSSINNIPLSEINDKVGGHQISDVEFDSYTITVTTNANTTGRSGGSSIQASENNVMDVFKAQVQEIILPNTDIAFSANLTSARSIASEDSAYTSLNAFEVIPNENIVLSSPACVASLENENASLSGNKSFKMTATMTTQQTNVSPVIDLERLSLITVSNRIDRPSSSDVSGFNTVENFVTETSSSGGSALAKHFTKAVSLNEDADSLTVYLNVNRPSGSYIDVYYKVSNSDGSEFTDQDWELASPDNEIPFSENSSTFNEVSFTIDETEIGQTFTVFALKIVFTSTNSSQVPLIKDLRGIATT